MQLENPTVIYSELNEETKEFLIGYKLMLNKEVGKHDIGWGVRHAYSSHKDFLKKPKWMYRAHAEIGVFSELIKGRIYGPLPKTIVIGLWVCNFSKRYMGSEQLLIISHTFTN